MTMHVEDRSADDGGSTDLVARLSADVLERLGGPDAIGRAPGGWSRALWDAFEAAGLTLVGVDERHGGSGGTVDDLLTIARVCGRYAAPIPLVETALSARLLAASGLPIPGGPLAPAPVNDQDRLHVRIVGGRETIDGRAERVPWARIASTLVVAARDAGDRMRVALVAPATCVIRSGWNLAREPRDTVLFENAPAINGASIPGDAWDRLLLEGALARAAQTAGALERVLQITSRYASVREQFGRPISRFQAIQGELARLAGELALLSAALRGASSVPGEAEIAAVKVCAAVAGSEGARIAHQVHGAIGLTHEHMLHLYTTRLWSWRDEFGRESVWSERLGRFAISSKGAGYWSWLTGGGSTA